MFAPEDYCTHVQNFLIPSHPIINNDILENISDGDSIYMSVPML